MKHVLWAKQCSKHYTCIDSFYPPNNKDEGEAEEQSSDLTKGQSTGDSSVNRLK